MYVVLQMKKYEIAEGSTLGQARLFETTSLTLQSVQHGQNHFSLFFQHKFSSKAAKLLLLFFFFENGLKAKSIVNN